MDHCNNSRTHEAADDDFDDLVSSEKGHSIEQVENNERTLNGMLKDLQIHHATEQADGADMLGDAWNDLAPSFCGGSLNDILNSNRQGASATLAGSSPVLYDNSNKFNRFNQLAVLSEDLRISKILRRLMIETNRRAAVELCKKLENAVRNQSNASYICRSFDILFDNMISVLRQCPTECLENASVILGILGYINRYDFVVFKNNLTKCYANNKSLRQYLMMALRTTISCDAVNLDLKPYSERLLALLKEYLENAEVAENFVAISETISELSKHYKQSFLRHFTDIVDIIIGWHLEIEQPAYLKRHCGKILQQFAEYFLSELDFTLGLLGQFIEDIEACGGDEVLAEEVSMKSKQQTEARVGAFIGAFTSIIKAMVSRGVVLNNFNASANILQDAKRVVNKVAKQCFHIVALISEETVINLNEFYCVISSYDKSVENLCDLERVIELQLNHLSGFNENQVASFLYMVLNIVRQYRTQLPLSFVSLIMNKDNICLQEIKLSCGMKTYRLLLKTYHEILNIKNVPLLQEAYRHILKDINETIGHLKNSHKSMYSVARCELILSFYLAALSVMACQTSSIIGMYALNPSILELLITNCQAANESLWTKYPTLHQALLGVIILHSSKNYNFRQSSRLLVQHQDSPTSENFSIILKFLANIMRWYVSPGLLKWIEQLLVECKDDYAVLTEKDDFLNMCENVALFSRSNPNLEISNIIRSIIRYPKMPDYILYNVYHIALGALERTDDELLTTYCEIMALLPLDICLSPDQESQLFYENKGRLNHLYHWHKSTTCYNTLRPKYFKTFIETLEPNSSLNKESLYQIFIEKSFVHLHREHVNEYLKMVQGNKQLRNFHLQYEAARYCVQQKLRTVLGKPQETFLAIEAIIMKYARLLAEKDRPENMQSFDNVMQMQENCRMLLGFLDNLEKHIYNAAEGTAYAMLPAEKPAKTFFRVNASTCGEWFKRIRTAVNLIGLHCMEPEMVIRYSESILQNDSALTNRGYLDRTITTMVWALFSCRESDYLIGLHTWLKTKHCKGYDWIQYVADHASGHLEKATAGYLSVLNDENALNMDAFIKEFIQKQLSDCLYNIHTEVQSQYSPSVTYSQNHLECMEAIYQNAIAQSCGMENDNFQNALHKMTEWTDGKDKSNKSPKQIETFSYYEILRTLQESCLARSPFGNGNDIDVRCFDAVKKCIQQGLRENIVHSFEPGSSHHLLNELILLNHVAHKMELDDNISICGNGNNISSELLKKALCWSLVIDSKSARQHIPLLLSMASKARLENNLGYSHSLLEQFFKLKDIDKPLLEIAQELKANQFYVDYSDLDIISGVEELIKCIHAQNTSILEVLEVGSACCVQIIQKNSETLSPPTLPHSISNFLLTMSDWLSAHRLNNSLTHGQQFKKLQNLLPDIGLCSYSDTNKSCILPATEYAVGKLLNASTLCSKEEKSGEAWFLFGNWCYRWGKKLMETSGEQTDVKEVKLTNRNIVSIQDILGEEFGDELTNRIVELLNAHMVNAIKDDNVDDDVCLDTHNASEVLENELKNMCNISSEQLTAIVGIWRQAQKGVYGFYEEATRAYFRYLAIQSDAVMTKNSISNAPGTEDCTFVTTTLRLLRLIVKHATGLQDVLEEGLRTTPLRPWKVIVPQLFSRLNHHEHYVRRSVSDLLCRLAVNKPQLIIFPAVVGAQQELKHSDGADSHMQLSNCFMVLLNSLSSQAPDMVLQVQMLVKELRRITLLWEEYWIHSLAQLYSEYSHLYNALDAESKKSRHSDELLAKYEIFRQHLLSDFRKIVAVTEKEVETNYERNFQERFKHHIDIVLQELQKPSDSIKSSEYWQKIKQLYNTFQQRPLRGSSSTIRISDVSPVLANMRNTNIAMPGVDNYEKSGVYIKAVDSTIFILPTKTKPKKLSLCGSNGQSYTYLFKGQEDLHLDERIMQFLSISNSMMSRSHSTKSADSDSFRAHYYSVIPLGSQSGLISWVDNCTPLFGIYKKWQQREATLKQQQKERQPSKSHEQGQSPAATTSRPSELFYNKLTPLLAERNLKISDPRKQWPMTVLRSVLRELSKETPADLLSKEIWCYSTNAVEWRKSVRRYTMSLAVMSIIGYVIGLGDRHLDNILIKLGTGEIVHIDYNVCFEKGKSLRVPEKVPFRMSQNLKAALGLVGTEGPYRLACSHVLKVLRKERETLLTLLEAFVYDPLVDWTISDDGSTNRGTSAHTAAAMITSLGTSKDSQLSPNDTFKIRKHDAELSRQTLTLKVTEVKPAWLKYRNVFEIQLKCVKDHVQNVLDVRQNILQLEQERDNYTKQLAMIRELDALGSARGSHALNTVTQRYKAYKRDLDSFETVKQLVQQTIKDIDIVLITYFDVLLRPNEINSIDINFPSDDMDECDLVKGLLLGNAVDKFAKHEMENSFIQTHSAAVECRDLLFVYSHVMRFYPRCKLMENRLIKYKRAFSDLIDVCEGDERCSSAVAAAASGVYDENHSIESCNSFFEQMIMIYTQLQSKVMEAQAALEQQQQQMVIIDKVDALNCIDDFVHLDSPRNRQHVLIYLVRRIELAYKSFILEENELLSGDVFFLLNRQINFLQFVDKFVNYLNPTHKPDVLHLLIESLLGLQDFRDSLEDACEKIFSIFMMGDSLQSCGEVNVTECSKTYPEISVIIEETDADFKNTIFRLQRLQEKLSHLQEIQPNADIHNIMNYWNINISDYIQSCRNENILRIISDLKLSTLAIRSNDTNNIFDMQQIKGHVNDTMLDIQSKLFNGLLSYAIELTTSSISDLVTTDDPINSKESITEMTYTLCDKLYVLLEHEALIQCDEMALIHYSKLLEQHERFTTCYYWLHEQHLEDVNVGYRHYIKSKQEFLSSLHNINQVLSVWKSTMVKIQADLEIHRKTTKEILSSKLLQSSSGEMQEGLLKLDDAIAKSNQRYEFFLSLATRLTEYSAVVLQFEISGADEPFDALIQQFNEERNKLQACEVSISVVERNLVQLLDPEDKIDQCWIENISDLLDEMIFSVQKKICDLEKDETSMENNLQGDGQKLQFVVDSSIRAELRQLLKMVTKSYKQSGKGDTIFQDIRDIQQTMKHLQSKLNELQIQLFSGEFETVMLIQLRAKVEELCILCYDNNARLNKLVERIIQIEDAQYFRFESPTRNENSKDVGINNSQLGEQKRNAYAVSVWKRIRMKLEGRDPDPNRRSSVTEQVDYVISEATNEDNLASLYEESIPSNGETQESQLRKAIQLQKKTAFQKS